MKKIALLTLTAAISMTQPAHSEEGVTSLASQIKSGNFCKKKIYDRFKLVEKTAHELLNFRPKKEMMTFIESMELMCPWSIERDFNGDKKKDWVGFVKIEDKFELLAYISNKRYYKIQLLETLPSLPETRFIRWIQTKYLKNYTDKKLHIGNSQYALQVANFEGTTDIYLWDGKELAKILTTPQLF